MSYTFQIFALIDGLVALVLFLWIRKDYTLALTTIEEKSGGLRTYYRSRLQELFRGRISPVQLGYLLHYLSLHLLVPLVGFGFFLRSDGNFLVVILSLIWTVQLMQRIFPGYHYEELEQ